MLLGFARGFFGSDGASLGEPANPEGLIAMTVPPPPKTLTAFTSDATDYPVLLEIHGLGTLDASRCAVGNAWVARIDGWFPASKVSRVFVTGDHEAREIRARQFADVGDLPLEAREDLFQEGAWKTDLPSATERLPRPMDLAHVDLDAFMGPAGFVATLMRRETSGPLADTVESIARAWSEGVIDDPVEFVSRASRDLAAPERADDFSALIARALIDLSPDPEPDGESIAESLVALDADNARWATGIARIHDVVSDVGSDVLISDPSAHRELQALLLLLVRPSPRGACGADWPGVDVEERTLMLADAWSHLLAGRLPIASERETEGTDRALTALVNHLNRAAGVDLPEFA